MNIPGFRGVPPGTFAKRLYSEFVKDAVTDSAAQLSYYLLFALFPFMFFLTTLLAYLPLAGAADDLMNRLSRVIPSQALGLIQDHLNNLLHRPKPHLLTISVVVALWSASRGADAFRKALNIAYDVHESRPFWKTNGVALLTTVAAALLSLLGITMIAAGGKAGFWLADKVGVGQQFAVVWSWLRWPTTALVIMLAAALAYFLLPDVKQSFRYITPGSVSATVLWLLGTWGFTEYVGHFGNYNVTYGSIGGVVILLTWLYISGLVFILGGEVNAIIEHLSASPDAKAEGAHAPGEAPPPKIERPSAAPIGAAKSAETAEEAHAEIRSEVGALPRRRGKSRGPGTRAPFFRFWKRPSHIPDDPSRSP